MTAELAAELCQTALTLALIVGGPILLAALSTSLIVGMLQAATQMHDQTLAFIPKFVVMSLVILFLLPWGISRLTEYATDLIRGIPGSI
ncbi:flagellar biosynthetic protein FliQ [Schlesneria paludicola]|uniref:flagellar biosynthetic protein FliQ n=1 Tax=Schlesneria paludicola TaxID=360056 RepID=UPI000299D11C|nr:flagellar biosynthetic protein FliQ [Schlesneria paludicola]